MDIKIKYAVDGLEPIQVIEKGNMIDLRAAEDVEMKKGEYRLISLGVVMEAPEGYYIEIFPRSSTFSKYHILMANSVGIVDHSYCGENDIVHFPAYAVEDTKIAKNTRIAQFKIVQEQPEINFVTVEKMENPDRKGFGSTGEV